MISIFAPVRSSINGFDNLRGFLKSFVENSSDFKNFELIFKLDNDDQKLNKIIEILEEYKKKGLSIKNIVTSSSDGYKSLKYFLTDLVLESNINTSLYWALPDDVRITQKDWDEKVLKCANEHHSNMFVIHTHRVDDLKNMDIHQAIQECEGFPIISKEWLHTQQGHFSFTGHVDSWTSATELLLYKKYKIDHRVELIPHILKRIITEDTDGVGSKRWNTVRREMLANVLKKKSYEMLESNVDNIYMKIMNEKGIKSYNDKMNEEKLDSHNNYLINMMLNSYDKYLIERQKNENIGKKNILQRVVNFSYSVAKKVAKKISSTI